MSAHLDLDALRIKAQQIYRLDDERDPESRGVVLDGTAKLTSDERTAMIIFVFRTDGIIGGDNDPRTWIDRHPAYVAGVFLGALRRAARADAHSDNGGN